MAGIGALVVFLLASTTLWSWRESDDIVLGAADAPATTAAVGPTVVVPVPPPDIGRKPIPEPRRAPGLKGADGRPYGRTVTFRSNIPVPRDLVFVLVVGSDARPGEDIRRTRGDSIHLLAVNPRTLEGTIVGFPRDSWVQIPGRGEEKINQALVRGGPQLMAETVRHLTGLPVHYWVLTGFAGLSAMVDELGGVDIHVDRRMNDKWSGAHFEPGWHHFDGAEALAYSRNRQDVPYGDFSRSENQGKLILAALAKMRAEVADDGGIRRWLGVLWRHVDLDCTIAEAERLAGLGRRLEPAKVRNIVLPGKVGTARGQSVVFLGEDAVRIFEDLRADAVLGAAGPEVTTTTSEPEPGTSTSSTTTSWPRPTPSSTTTSTSSTTSTSTPG